MGSSEVHTLNAALIKAVQAKKVLDIGVFTGGSSLAAALALPADGKIIACDIDEDFTKKAKQYWKEAGIESKISLRIAPVQLVTHSMT
jgi:predicted O-methyltransferase YrrM